MTAFVQRIGLEHQWDFALSIFFPFHYEKLQLHGDVSVDEEIKERNITNLIL